MRNEGENKGGLRNGLVSDQQPLKDAPFPLFSGLSSLALRDPPFMGLGSGSGTLRTGTGQVLGLVLGKTRWISFYISPFKNWLLGCAQCNMTARISPTERPGLRIRSGADHAKDRRDTAKGREKTLNGTADSAPLCDAN